MFMITLSLIYKEHLEISKEKNKQYNIKTTKNTERLFTEKEMQRFQKLRKDGGLIQTKRNAN